MLAREKFSPGFESMSCLRKSLITALLDLILISPVFGGVGGADFLCTCNFQGFYLLL